MIARLTLKRFHKDDSGLALIEFALTLPLLLSMGLVGIEVANYGIANLRVSQIAMLTADNAGRVRTSISEADIADLMTGAKIMGQGIQFGDNGRIVLTSLEPKTTGTAGQWIRWQRCYGGKAATSTYGTPKTSGGTVIANGTEAFNSAGAASTSPSDQTASVPTNGSAATPTTGMGPAGKQILAAGGTALMFVEVTYDYQPIVNAHLTDWLGGRTITSTSAFNVRQRTNQVLQPAGYTTAQRYTCDKYTS